MTSTRRRVVLASRFLHGAISALFLTCIVLLWLGAVRGRADALTLAALGALVAEGALVLAAAGNCPLAPLWRRLGDETPFFELILPARVAKAAFPIFTLVCVAGAILLAARTL